MHVRYTNSPEYVPIDQCSISQGWKERQFVPADVEGQDKSSEGGLSILTEIICRHLLPFPRRCR